MAPTTPDNDFCDFVRTGDPKALGAVFDALASDLLIVAAHLARSGTEAEDLVQSTFVTAIEERSRFDTTRPVKPWLVGILANKARTSNRKAHRVPDTERLHVAHSEDPADAIDKNELATIVATTIERLPKHYRQVLHLRLVHDLQLSQIASALEIPLPTAKSRLSRGLDKLRNALPQGVAVAGVLALSTDRLAAMREIVLGSATVVTPAVASSSWAGSKLVALAVALPLLLWPIVSHWSDDAPRPTPAAGRTAALAAERKTERPPSEALTDTVAEAAPQRTPAPTTSTPATAVPDPSGFTVTGTCVDDATNAPLQAKLTVLASDRRGAGPRLGPGPRPEHAVHTAATDADGTFSLALAHPGTLTLRLAVTADGYAERRRPIYRHRSGVMDVGEMRLQLGTTVKVSALDEDDAPVADARLVFCAPRDWHPRAGARTGYRLQTSAAGTATTYLPPGDFELHCEDDHGLVEPLPITIDNRLPRVVLARIRRPDTIQVRGTVVDDAGQPRQGIRITIPMSSATTDTDKNGAFQIAMPRGRVTTLLAEDLKRTLADGHARIDVTENEPVVIEMRRLRSMICTVTRADTGAPVERFAVFGGGRDDGEVLEHPGGKVRFGPPVEKRTISIAPDGDELVGSAVIHLDARKETHYDIKLYPRIDWGIRVIGSDGQAVAGSTVELLHHHDTKTPVLAPSTRRTAMSKSRKAVMRLARSIRTGEGMPPRANGLLQLATATTDATGHATLPAGRGQPGLTLRVTGQHASRVLHDVSISTDGLVVRVANGATVRGTIAKEPFQRILPAAYLRNARMRATGMLKDAIPGVFFTRAAERHPHGQERIPVDDDGTFVAEGLPVGTWTVHLWMPASSNIPPQFGWTTRLTRIEDLRAGEKRELTLQLDAVVGAVDAVVSFDGKPAANRELTLQIPPVDGGSFFHHERRVKTDDAGRFVTDGLPAGVYNVLFSYDPESEGRHGSFTMPQQVIVQGGQRTVTNLSSPRRTARVRLLDKDGAPVAGCVFELRRGRSTHALVDGRTDDDGWFVLDPVPYGKFELLAGNRKQSFEVELPAHERHTEWVLRRK